MCRRYGSISEYRALQPNFTSQAYLQYIHSFDHLKSLARFVTSSHRLGVETGRWDRPPVPYAQRKCQICDTKIEDEFHFMFVCPLYNTDRTKLLPRYYRIIPIMQKFINLMKQTLAWSTEWLNLYTSRSKPELHISVNIAIHMYTSLFPPTISSLSVLPGYFREPHWKPMGLPEVCGVTWQHSSSANCVLRYPA